MPDLSGLRCTYLPHWSQGFLEEVIVELLKAGTSQRLRQVHTFSQTLNLHSDLQADAAAEYVPKGEPVSASSHALLLIASTRPACNCARWCAQLSVGAS